MRFGWALEGAGTGRAQHAYQIQVAAAGTAFGRGHGLTWDSGRVECSGSADISYAGAPLTRGAGYTWQVRVWDETGTASAWSTPASFEVELDPDGGWRGSWNSLPPVRERVNPPSGAGLGDHVAAAMSPAPYLRRIFTTGRPRHVRPPVRDRPRAVGGTAQWPPGRRCGPHPGPDRLQPAHLIPDLRRHQDAVRGDNVIGVILADGWYAGYLGFDAKRRGAHYGAEPELLAQLTITYADGSQEQVVTDQHWQAGTGAIRHADLLMGERHDLRLEPLGWDVPGSPLTAGWHPARCRALDGRPVVADPGPPIRVTEDITCRGHP